jgi:hypothetical protein
MLSLAPRTGSGSTGGSGTGAAAAGGARQEELVEALANDLLDQVCCTTQHSRLQGVGNSSCLAVSSTPPSWCHWQVDFLLSVRSLQPLCTHLYSCDKYQWHSASLGFCFISLSVLLLLLQQVPAPFNLEAVMKAKQDDPSALHVVLFQEVSSRLQRSRASLPTAQLSMHCSQAQTEAAGVSGLQAGRRESELNVVVRCCCCCCCRLSATTHCLCQCVAAVLSW